MSCGCNNGWGDNGAYSGVCDTDTPYPSVSSESVPSLISNLVDSLYGEITKDVFGGKVVWNIPCDPNKSATIFGIPREAGEGLLCYFMRVWNVSGLVGVVTTNDVQTLTNKTLTSPTINTPTISNPTITGTITGNSFILQNASLNGTTVSTDNSANTAFRITQTGTGNAFLVEDSTNPDSTPFVITASGDVGLGKLIPATKLDIVGSIAATGNVTVPAGSSFNLDATGATKVVRNTTLNGIDLFSNSSARMHIGDSGNVGIGTTAAPTGRLDVVGSAGTVRVATTGDDIAFTKGGANSLGTSTANGTLTLKTGAGVSAVTIDASQNVGVGTTGTLTTKFEVNGQIKATSLIAPLIGITNASNAASGEVGQIITNTNPTAVAFTVPAPNPASQFVNLTSINLTPGDWLIWGAVLISTAVTGSPTTGLTRLIATIHTSNSTWDATLPERSSQLYMAAPTLVANTPSFNLQIAPSRVNITATTQYFLNALCAYLTLPPIARGTITALRIR